MLRHHMHRRHVVLHCSSRSTHTMMFTPVCSRLPNVQTCFILAMSLPIKLCHAQPYSFTQQNDMQLIQATCIAQQCSSNACHPSSSSIVSHCSAARRLLPALGFTGSWWDSTCLFARTRCAVSSLLGWTCTAASIIGHHTQNAQRVSAGHCKQNTCKVSPRHATSKGCLSAAFCLPICAAFLDTTSNLKCRQDGTPST